MKTILSLLFIFGIASVGGAQICCQLSSDAAFAMLASDDKFVSSHTYNFNEPGSLKEGTNITFKVSDNKPANGYLINGNPKSKNYLFVFQEWWGLNPHIKKEAEKYFEALGGDFHVLAIDLYDGATATTAEEAGQLMKSRDEARLRNIIKGAFAYAGEDAKVATIGWCFGGGWSLQSAIMGGEQVEACVMYYGMPEKDPNAIEKLEAPVLGIFAEQDGWINHDLVDTFEDRMRALEKEISVHWYDAVHAFANPSNQEYDVEKAGDAFNKSVAFILEQF